MSQDKRRLLSKKHRTNLSHRISLIDHRHLLYLHEVGTSGSVRRAAEVLNSSASVLSRQIAKMESDLQVQLLDRHGRGATLTEAGSLLVAYFAGERLRLDQVVTDIQDLKEMRRGVVSIAVGEGFLSDLMGDPLRTFSQNHPMLRIDLKLGATDDVVNRVLDDTVQIGLLYNLSHEPRVVSHISKRHPMRVVTHPKHPLAKLNRKLKIQDLKDYDLGLLPGGFGVRQALFSAEQGGKIQLAPKLTSDSSRVLPRFAEEWGGVILTPEFSIRREVNERRLVALEIADAFLEGVEAHMITRAGRRLPTAALKLLRHLKTKMPMFQV